MFILVDDGLNDPYNKDLAVNLNSADKISIRFINGRFTLIMEETIEVDAWQSIVIANFTTMQDAIDCFVQMMAAYQQGNLVWTAPKSVS